MILQSLDPNNFHTIDADLWAIIKYLFVVIGGFLVYYAKGIQTDIQSMKTDIALMKLNSDNTQHKLGNIEEELKDVGRKLDDHEKRIIRLEKVG